MRLIVLLNLQINSDHKIFEINFWGKNKIT